MIVLILLVRSLKLKIYLVFDEKSVKILTMFGTIIWLFPSTTCDLIGFTT